MKTIFLTENARAVLSARYLKKDSEGKPIETPEEMFQRVAQTVAQADLLFDKTSDMDKTAQVFYDLMINRWFLPNSPTLMNAGRHLGQLAACFVLPIEDSMESIFETLKHTAMIHKSGGGTGFSFSRIRPAKDTVLSTAGVSSGPVSFMSVYDIATETVKQGGTRRGANIAVLRVDHPDIVTFIQSKNQSGKLTNFNISVAITQAFMDALESGLDYDLINPRTGQKTETVSAKSIFDMIVDAAWRSGEPGILFIDRINQFNPTPHLGMIESTNPCGEQPLLPYESCTLGSINLSEMVVRNTIDDNRLKNTIWNAVHFLDNVIEINKYPLPQIEKMSKATRKIGLGVMGFADMLIKLGIPYDSEKAVDTAEKIMAFISKESTSASAELAKTRGNFPAYQGSVYDSPNTPFMRNATRTTIAPTGTISIIAGASSGIEPIFSLCHVRHVLDGKQLIEIHPLFVEKGTSEGWYSDDLLKQIEQTGSIQNISTIPERVKQIFKTSHDISIDWHIRIQAAFQKYTDNAVSKTVNFPESATRQDVELAFRKAYEAGCKGITIYRYGSRSEQALNLRKSKKDTYQISPRPRPNRTTGITERIRTGCGNLYVTVNFDENGMCEVFAQMGKTGGCASSQTEAAGRLISLALRSGVKVEAIIRQLIGIRCPSPSWQNGVMTLSCPDAIAQVLKNITQSNDTIKKDMVGICPDCQQVMFYDSGCMTCHSCGYSKCS